MAWIREIDEGEATGELAEVYQDVIGARGKLANILKVHSLNPGALRTHVDLYMHLMFGRSKLSRAEREAIGVAVSAANRCEYCVNHHAEALRRYDRDEARVALIMSGEGFGELTPRLGGMLDYASRLTTRPSGVGEPDLTALREAGMSDEEILDVALIAAYFNFVNRLALGLGVACSAEELTGYDV